MRLALLALLLGNTLHAADWPQWLGPRRDNTTTETVAPWTGTPKELWRVPVGPGYSIPVTASGKTFIHHRIAGKEIEELFALDAVTGKELWRTPYPRPAYSSVLNTGPQGTPAVAGKRVFAFGITGVLTCFDADSGKIVWQVDTRKQFKAPLPRFGVTCSPLVVGDRVIVAVGGKDSAVVAFDAATGDVKWQALDETAGTTSPVLYATPNTVGRPPDVAFMTNLRLVGLNPLDGSVNWEYGLPFHPSGTAPTPLVAGGLIVATTTQNGSVAVKPATGDKSEFEAAWKASGVKGYFSTGVAVGPDLLCLVTNILEPVPNADMTCLDLKTGKELWKQKALGYFHFGPIRTGDNKVLLLNDMGVLKLASVDAKGFKELCQAKVCGGTMVAPALAGGRLYVRDDKEVICYEMGK